jgi:hypothetical protein
VPRPLTLHELEEKQAKELLDIRKLVNFCSGLPTFKENYQIRIDPEEPVDKEAMVKRI